MGKVGRQAIGSFVHLEGAGAAVVQQNSIMCIHSKVGENGGLNPLWGQEFLVGGVLSLWRRAVII